MTVEEIRAVLGWCAVINVGLLLLSCFAYTLGRDFIYRIHSKWFKLSEERYDEIIFNRIGGYKLLVFVFNIVPYLAFRIVI